MIDNLLVRIHFIIEMIWWTGLASWEFECCCPGRLIATFLYTQRILHKTLDRAKEGVQGGGTTSKVLIISTRKMAQAKGIILP